jgi:hypothetical protein
LKRAVSNVTVVIRTAGKKLLLKRVISTFHDNGGYIHAKNKGQARIHIVFYDKISSGFLWEIMIRTRIPNPKSPNNPKNPQINS